MDEKIKRDMLCRAAKRLIVATPEVVNYLGFAGSPSEAVYEYAYSLWQWRGKSKKECRAMARYFKAKSELGEWTTEAWSDFREEARKYGGVA